MRRIPVLIAALLLLAACAAAPIHACPPVPKWTDEEKAGLAREIRALPDGTFLERAVSEYTVMREQSRQCAAGGPL